MEKSAWSLIDFVIYVPNVRVLFFGFLWSHDLIFGFQFCIHSSTPTSVVYDGDDDDEEDPLWAWTTIVRADIVVVVVVAGETRREGGGTMDDFDVHSFHVDGFVRRRTTTVRGVVIDDETDDGENDDGTGDARDV